MKKENIGFKKTFKLAHIIARMGTGGAEENTRYTIQGLNKDKYEIDLIVGDEFGNQYEKIFQENKIRVIKIPGFIGNLHPLYDIRLFVQLINIFNKNKYDIIHTHGTKAGIIGRIAARIAGVPIIIHGLHGNALDAFSSKLLNKIFLYSERIAGTFTDAHISVSSILSQNYIKQKIGKSEKYFTVRSGMDLTSFSVDKDSVFMDKRRELGINNDDFVVLNISRLEPLKGHPLLLRAFKLLENNTKNSRLTLLIVGEGKEKDRIYEEINELGLANNVILKGYRNDIPEILAISNILVHTSYREGLPRVMVQAATAGIPIVAFNVDGIPEIITDGFNGYLIEPGNVEQLADRMNIYLNNPELLQVHGNNGKKIVKNRWTIEGMVEETEKIYQKLIEEKK